MSPGTSEISERDSPFYPPRAADAPLWRRAARVIDRRLEGWAGRIPSLENHDLAAVLSLVPGLGHLFVERRPGKAAGFFFGYLAVLAWVWLFSGLSAFWMAMLPLSLHQWMISDCATRARRKGGLKPLQGRSLVLFSGAVGILLLTLYHQAGVRIARYGSAVRLSTAAFEPLLCEGDRLLIRPKASYRRGDIVYEPSHGELERIVGMPGDEITVDHGVLRVNGSIPIGNSAPLGQPLLSDMEGAKATVAEGYFCIFFPARNHGIYGARLLQFFMIPQHRIAGRVVLRYYPEYVRFP